MSTNKRIVLEFYTALENSDFETSMFNKEYKLT